MKDNGGLQAISILRVLKDVCKRLSERDGHATPLRPCELFDVIGGIGTGGWLAILLGRYRLRIDQCLSIYVKIATAMDPMSPGQKRPSGTAALSQKVLIAKINKIIEEHEIGEYLLSDNLDQEPNAEFDRCHAFAVGVVKQAKGETAQQYRLFRAYEPPAGLALEGPDPKKCKVAEICAATAAAKDLLGDWVLDVDGKRYCDDNFPRTHNVSDLALDETISLFGKERGMRLDFVLNISPGVVSPKDVDELSRQVSASTRKRWWKARRFLSDSRLHERKEHKVLASCVPIRGSSYSGQTYEAGRPGRSDTSSSTSSDASQTERGHQKAIRERLLAYAPTSGREELYFRLELSAKNDKPYLNDIAKPELAMQLAQDFLHQSDTQSILDRMVPQTSITGRPTTQSPRQSFVSTQDFAPVSKESTLIEAH